MKLDRQHEDVITIASIASSDIVVIRNDDISIASGSHRRTGSDQISISASAQKHSDDESTTHDRLMTLEAKLKHRDQRLEELSRLTDILKGQNATLAQRNKQVSNKYVLNVGQISFSLDWPPNQSFKSS